jgi:hypothetical protein
MATSTQLCYWSQTIGDGYASESDLREILSASRAGNERAGITGALLTGDGWFAQVLEGSPEAVHALAERIQRDPRHHDVVRLPERTVAERTFPDWAMGFAMTGHSEQVEQIRSRACADHDEAAAETTLALIQESIDKFKLW